MTEEWIARRRRRLLVAWGVGLVSLGVIGAGVARAAKMDDPSYLLIMVLGIIGVLAALIGGQMVVGMVRPKRMTDEYIWLKGVHPDFLDRLEPWPYRI